MITEFLVVSTGKNCGQIAKACAQSVKMGPPAFHVYIAADCTDETARNATIGGADLVLQNNLSALENLYFVLASFRRMRGDPVIVCLDGDDWLEPDALARVAEEYEKHDCLMTYGQFRYADGTKGWASEYPMHVTSARSYRKDIWRATHLKTYRASLFQKIPPSEFMSFWTQSWFTLACDMAVMFPMLEMAGSRARFIPDELYVYNYEHSWERNEVGPRVDERRAVEELRNREPLLVRRAAWKQRVFGSSGS